VTYLTGPEIARQIKLGTIEIDPFDEANLNPNTYNLTLGRTLVRYTGDVLDANRPNDYEEITLGDDGIILAPNRIYLGHSVERIGADLFVPTVHSRSGAARLGFFSTITAELIDLGSHGQSTFQIHVVQPLRVYPGRSYSQVAFQPVVGTIVKYDGKYQGSKGPRVSEIHRDFQVEQVAA